ncbi:MAG: PAS domain S-box protein [Gaiellales bacterium]
MSLSNDPLELERTRFSLLAMQAPIGILETDREHRCRFVNERLCELLDRPQQELIGFDFMAAVHPVDRERVTDELAGSERLGGEFSSEFRLRRPDATTLWVRATAIVVRDTDGGVTARIGTVTDITEQRRAQAEREMVLAQAREAAEQAEQERALLDVVTANLTDVVYFYDAQRRLRYVTPSFERLTGYTADDLQADPMIGVHADDVEGVFDLWQRTWAGESYVDREYRIVTRQGDVRWLWSTGAPVTDADGEQIGVQFRDVDVTPRVLAEARMRASEERARAIVDTTSEAFVATDAEGRVTEWNRAAELLFGWPRSEVVGRPLAEAVAEGDAEEALNACVRDGGGGLRDQELVLRTAGGSSFTAEVNLWPSGSGHELCLNLFAHDITERKRREQRVEHLAFHDQLTGLANRTQFEQGLDRAIAAAGGAGRQVALLYVDLDRFKAVNDLHGHACGDELLQQVAGRLTAAARAEDMVVRMGGDEFVLMLSDLPPGEASRISERVARRIMESMAEPFALSSTVLRMSASIGIALYPDHARDAAVLVRAADRGMYASKRQGQGFSALPESA